MKYLTIPTLLILSACTPVVAQQKQITIPAKMKIELSDKQFVRIDSAVKTLYNQIDSKSFSQWFINSFDPIYRQMEMQADTSKKRKS